MSLNLESIKEMSLEDLTEKFNLLLNTDPILAWQFLEKFGYDLWLENVMYPSTEMIKDRSIKIELLESLRKFVEIFICKERADLSPFKPYKI